MGKNGFFPTTDGGLFAWSSTFRDKILQDPESWGIPFDRAADYALVHERFADAYLRVVDPGTRTVAAVSAKNDARELLKDVARSLALLVRGQGFPATRLFELGLTVRKPPSAIGPPEVKPNVSFGERDGDVVEVRVRGETYSLARPKGTAGYALYVHVGPTPPAEPGGWVHRGNFVRPNVRITFPGNPPGTQVWVQAAYYNPRGQRGPASDPRNTYLAGGGFTVPTKLAIAA